MSGVGLSNKSHPPKKTWGRYYDFTIFFKQVARVLVFTGVLAALTSQTCSQELPPLRQGAPYAKERQRLLDGGWQKVIDLSKSCDTTNGSPRNPFSKDTCFKYQEHDECSGTGYCSFRWRNAQGLTMRITTYGPDFKVLSWSIE